MREMDSIGLKLCSFQAELFEASVPGKACSSGIFIRRFMSSCIAGRMDNAGFLFESVSVQGALNELDEQYGVSNYGSEKYSPEEMHWIGYIYRYWAYIYDIPSKQLYKEIKPDKLRKLYFPYHSLDPRQAIDRISEEQGCSVRSDWGNIARGVEVLRKVRSKTEAADKSTFIKNKTES